MEPMINNGDNRKEKRIISEPTPVDLDGKHQNIKTQIWKYGK